VTTRDKHSLIQNSRDEIVFLARLDENSFNLMDTITEQPQHSVRINVADITSYVLLEGLIDLEMEHKRISKQVDKVEKQIQQLNNKLASPFVQKADPTLVEKERSKLVEFEAKLEQLQEQLSFIA
jgi:valyl-tRNA synthetase